MTTDINSIPNQFMRGLAYGAMEDAWHAEWIKLSSPDQANIVKDFLSAGCSVSEYHDRIYKGNLQSYANTIR